MRRWRQSACCHVHVHVPRPPRGSGAPQTGPQTAGSEAAPHGASWLAASPRPGATARPAARARPDGTRGSGQPSEVPALSRGPRPALEQRAGSRGTHAASCLLPQRCSEACFQILHQILPETAADGRPPVPTAALAHRGHPEAQPLLPLPARGCHRQAGPPLRPEPTATQAPGPGGCLPPGQGLPRGDIAPRGPAAPRLEFREKEASPQPHAWSGSRRRERLSLTTRRRDRQARRSHAGFTEGPRPLLPPTPASAGSGQQAPPCSRPAPVLHTHLDRPGSPWPRPVSHSCCPCRH